MIVLIRFLSPKNPTEWLEKEDWFLKNNNIFLIHFGKMSMNWDKTLAKVKVMVWWSSKVTFIFRPCLSHKFQWGTWFLFSGCHALVPTSWCSLWCQNVLHIYRHVVCWLHICRWDSLYVNVHLTILLLLVLSIIFWSVDLLSRL